MHPLTEVELSKPTFKADPYPLYARLRVEAPVYANETLQGCD